MAASSAGYHEPLELLSKRTMDMHRAIVSLIEELEAMDWYAQRVDAATDDDVRAILLHNGNEEKEHAAMLLEWIRRHDPVFEAHLKTYLFREGSIVEREEMVEAAGQDRGGPPARTSVRPTIGSLKGGPER